MSRDLDRCNKVLSDDLGTEHGHQRFKWCFSENLFMPMRKAGEYNYKANEHGILEAHYAYELRKTAPQLVRQWVVCRWQPPMRLRDDVVPGQLVEEILTESEWQAFYGKDVEYPRNGYYAPTNVTLDPDIKPWDTSESGESLTITIARMLKAQLAKTYQQHLAEGEDIINARERAVDKKREALIDEVADSMTFLHTPGDRNGPVSYPAVERKPKNTVIITGATPQGA